MKTDTKVKKGAKLLRVAVYVTVEGMHDQTHTVTIEDKASKKDRHLWNVKWRNKVGGDGLSTIDDRDVGLPVAKLLNMDGARNGLLMVVSGCVHEGEPVAALRARCREAAVAQGAEMHDRWGRSVDGMKGRKCATS